ncbi:AGAP008193-PA-like protein [Anopheles sinensis]|uniref:AGAP008193-PA-like protein n=1 Tax=Anopheles sinensis TaxID=74873 RepID=A0A084VEQ0_ANOSI|nr:AGAP008193-PA-like protein [Anopheles sinensis]
MSFNIVGSWYLRGIVSFSPSRPNGAPSVCDPTKPTVFTDVAKYRYWIMRYTNTADWLKELEPCSEGKIDKNTWCNAASQFKHGYFIAAKENNIIRVPINGDPAYNEPEDIHLRTLHGLDYDCVEGRFYWIESKPQSIVSAKYDGTDKKPFITKHIEDPRYLAVDWISRHLYWLDYKKETIEVANLDDPDLRTVVSSDVDYPDEIAVDPVQGVLYRMRENVAIEWSNLDGSEPELSLVSTSLRISDMKVSIPTGELCYINQGMSQIDCIDTRNKQIRTIVSNLTNPRTFAIADELFFWTEDNSGTIESINLQNERQKPIPYNMADNIFLLSAVSGFCPRFYSPCAINNGECPGNTICLLNPRVPSGKMCKSIVFKSTP